MEIWNLVFMQFNRNAEGVLTPLPKPCVDTGAGLERLTAVLQDEVSNFDTDLFQPLIDRASELCGFGPHQSPERASSFRIVADHSRAATFLLADGVIPSNEGRGYVLRKIIRRAMRHARMINAPSPFLSRMAEALRQQMADPYSELAETASRVDRILNDEESRFTHTVNVGLKKLDEDLSELRMAHGLGDAIEAENLRRLGFTVGTYPGDKAFKLYDTYGLPRDFIEVVCGDAGLRVDWATFEEAMQEQRERAKASWKGAAKEAASPVYAKLADTFRTEPDFYYCTETRDCHIEAIVTKDGHKVNEVKPGTEAEVVLDRTTFYAESGGQVADTGKMYDSDRTLEVAEVTGAYYPIHGLIAHRVTAKETLRVGDRIACVADAARRDQNRRNHTATHLMHAALRNILGTHVKQSGSLVAPDHLRFDFTHFAGVDAAELADIEQQVNEQILKNTALETGIMNLDDALAS
ncbi:MAG: alanine--tRNA ligase-related protein, partial [Candidatus Acidiferrales bacterium]